MIECVSKKTFRRTESWNNEIGFLFFESQFCYHNFEIFYMRKLFQRVEYHFQCDGKLKYLRGFYRQMKNFLAMNQCSKWIFFQIMRSKLIVRFTRLRPTEIMYFIGNMSSTPIWNRWCRHFIPWLIEHCTPSSCICVNQKIHMRYQEKTPESSNILITLGDAYMKNFSQNFHVQLLPFNYKHHKWVHQSIPIGLRFVGVRCFVPSLNSLKLSNVFRKIGSTNLLLLAIANSLLPHNRNKAWLFLLMKSYKSNRIKLKLLFVPIN